MKSMALRRFLCGLALLLLPALAVAEVSVQLDRNGQFKQHLFLTEGRGRSGEAVIWGQVRGYLPQHLMLNPLGDVRGDLAPTIATHPATGFPWVVWPSNEGNQKRLVFSTWDGGAWTVPAQVVTLPDPMASDQLDPTLAFDPSGRAYLVWWVDGQIDQVFFSTLDQGRWTPPLLISDEAVDSREPIVRLRGSSLLVNYRTPQGRNRLSLDVTSLLAAAESLMDSPIPPGQAPPEEGGPGEDGQERFVRSRP